MPVRALHSFLYDDVTIEAASQNIRRLLEIMSNCGYEQHSEYNEFSDPVLRDITYLRIPVRIIHLRRRAEQEHMTFYRPAFNKCKIHRWCLARVHDSTSAKEDAWHCARVGATRLAAVFEHCLKHRRWSSEWQRLPNAQAIRKILTLLPNEDIACTEFSSELTTYIVFGIMLRQQSAVHWNPVLRKMQITLSLLFRALAKLKVSDAQCWLDRGRIEVFANDNEAGFLFVYKNEKLFDLRVSMFGTISSLYPEFQLVIDSISGNIFYTDSTVLIDAVVQHLFDLDSTIINHR